MLPIQVLITILGVVGFFFLLWTLWAFRLLLVFNAYERNLKTFFAACYLRNNALPLFIALMQSQVVKSEEVFAHAIQLRLDLLHDQTLAGEDELTGKIQFFFEIAAQHPEFSENKKFQKISGEIRDGENKLNPLRAELQKDIEKWNRALKTGKWILFPGNYFMSELGD